MYDYVIVGAGSAGCVLASRLSEDPSVSVLLIEAGPPDDSEDIHAPLGYVRLARAAFDWDYSSLPEPRCGGRSVRLPRGRVLGGSSSTNAMIYMRGNPLDYDDWRLPGWSWAELLPYFLRAEDNSRGASRWHGAGGPLRVSDPIATHEVSRAFLAAARAAGVPLNEDFNDGEQDGAGSFQLTQRDGRRESTADAYLRPAAGRSNLEVITDEPVASVLLEGAHALGVRTEASATGGARELLARREVILACGTYNTPQLLMRSGIGPGAHLRECGIEVIVDRSAVGENLSEHVASELLWMMPEPPERERRRRWRSTRLMLGTQRGAFTAGLSQVGALLRSEQQLGAPDIQLHCAPVFFAEDADERSEAHGVWVSPCLLTPASRGTVRLRADDPTGSPAISNDFYAQPQDCERMLTGLRAALELCAQAPLAELCAEPFTVPAGDGEQELRTHLAVTSFAFYHPVGTCRMGLDRDAVLDPELRVNGVERLRVIDASAMPAVPRGNTNAPTIALAERGADLVRASAASG